MSIGGNWDRRRMSRRHFITLGGMGAAALALGTLGSAQDASAAITFSSYPFKLGVASGDPRPDGVVLWTRLAPDPLRGGGMPNQNVAVRWEVASDSAMTKIVRSGTAYATPQFAHSVHVEVGGLQPGRFYWYRFKAGTQVSAKGRTKSAFQNLVGDRRVASKDGQISASIPLFWACSDPHRHLEWRF